MDSKGQRTVPAYTITTQEEQKWLYTVTTGGQYYARNGNLIQEGTGRTISGVQNNLGVNTEGTILNRVRWTQQGFEYEALRHYDGRVGTTVCEGGSNRLVRCIKH